jgi:hypothetical protein
MENINDLFNFVNDEPIKTSSYNETIKKVRSNAKAKTRERRNLEREKKIKEKLYVEEQQRIFFHEERLKALHNIDQFYYTNNNNFAQGYVILKHILKYENNLLTDDLLKIIWGYVTDIKHKKLEEIFPSNPYLENLTCPDCELIKYLDTNFVFSVGKCDSSHHNEIPIMLISNRTKQCYKFKCALCLIDFGYIAHDVNNCKIGYDLDNSYITNYATYDSPFIQFKEGCVQCTNAYSYDLTPAEKEFQVLYITTSNSRLCGLTKYLSNSHLLWNGIRWNYSERVKNLEKNNYKYNIRDRESFDIFMQHRKTVLRKTGECMICGQTYVFEVDGIILCGDVRCHWTFGITLNTFDHKNDFGRLTF